MKYRDGWMRGIEKGEGQNIARRLTEVPANIMTPVAFSQVQIILFTLIFKFVFKKKKKNLNFMYFTGGPGLHRTMRGPLLLS